MSVGVFVLLGAPGSGKGTQAKTLAAKNPGWVHISTGDLFRAEIASGSSLGNALKGVLAAGKLVSDEITNQVFESQVKQILTKGVVKVLMLDGYPRTAEQAETLNKFCAKTPSLTPPKVVEFHIDEEVVVKRLSDRLVNPRSGKIYHRVSNPPKITDVCDDDGGPLVQRPDDQPETIRKRFAIYAAARTGIVGALGGESSIKKVNADQAPDLVSKEVALAIQGLIRA